MKSVFVLLVGLTSLSVIAADIMGSAWVLDGDTVEISATRIRINGIDAPETDQVCLDAAGRRSSCGIAARQQLGRLGAGTWTARRRQPRRTGPPGAQ